MLSALQKKQPDLMIVDVMLPGMDGFEVCRRIRKDTLCLSGERACPPEDCGGVPGFANFLEIIKNPEHEEYESTIEWLNKKYDPTAFNIEKSNRYLKKLKWDRPTIDQLGKIIGARDGY